MIRFAFLAEAARSSQQIFLTQTTMCDQWCAGAARILGVICFAAKRKFRWRQRRSDRGNRHETVLRRRRKQKTARLQAAVAWRWDAPWACRSAALVRESESRPVKPVPRRSDRLSECPGHQKVSDDEFKPQALRV